MAWIEQVNRRSQFIKIFYDADTNKERVELTLHHQHYKDELDQWQDVDENFVTDGADGFTRKCDKTRHTIRIANGGNRRWYPRRNVPTEYVEIINIQYWRTQGGGSWHDINLPVPAWTNNHTTWDMANLTATLSNTWHRIKAEFVLKDATAPTRLRFAVNFVGLTYNPSTAEVISTTDGLVWGYINSPVSWYGSPPTKTFIPTTATYDGTYIEWSVDTTGATFPVYVDPTWTDGYGGDATTYKDTYLDHHNTTTNWGDYEYISIGDYDGDYYFRTLIGFAVASIPGDPVLDLVEFSLYQIANYATNARIVRVFRLKRDWVESEATWNIYSTGNSWATAGGFGSDDCEQTDIGYLSIPATGTQQYYTWTLTPTSKADLDLGYGWMVKADTENSDYHDWISSDSASTAQRPKLVIEYTPGTSVSLSTATLTATGIGAAVSAPSPSQSISLNTAALTASGINTSISAPPAGIALFLNTATLAATGINASILPGEATTVLNTAVLSAIPIPGSVFMPSGVYVILDTA